MRAGHSLVAGMHVVAEEMPTPVADEFQRVYDEQNLGISIDDALKSMCERGPNLDLFARAVAYRSRVALMEMLVLRRRPMGQLVLAAIAASMNRAWVALGTLARTSNCIRVIVQPAAKSSRVAVAVVSMDSG